MLYSDSVKISIICNVLKYIRAKHCTITRSREQRLPCNLYNKKLTCNLDNNN